MQRAVCVRVCVRVCVQACVCSTAACRCSPFTSPPRNKAQIYGLCCSLAASAVVSQVDKTGPVCVCVGGVLVLPDVVGT